MKCSRYLFTLAATLAIASSSSAAVIVQDRFSDNDRTDPAPPAYSELGVDGDGDGDIESAWFGTSGTLNATGGNLVLGTSGGTTSSQSWATYFTPESSPVTLANDGDQLKVTWAFNLSGADATVNGSQNMRIALVHTPAGVRLTSDENPGDGAYTGYAVFLNMGPTLNRSNPMELKPRTAASGNLLSSGANWGDVDADGGTNGATGYATGVDYTFEMTVTRSGAGLQVDTSMSGDQLNDTGSMSASYFDAAPTSFTFDTFTMRPSNSGTTAEFFNTTLFQVEGPVGVIPEPTTLALFGLSMMACMLRRSR